MAAKKGVKKQNTINVAEYYDLFEILNSPPEEILARGEALVKVIKKVNKANTTEAITSIKEIDKQSSKSESKGPSLKGPQTSMGLLQSLAKSTTSEKFASTQSTGIRTAASVLQGVAGSSNLVRSGLSMLSSGINVSSIAFSVLSTAVEKTVDAFVTAYNRLNEITNENVVKSNFSSSDMTELRNYLNDMRGYLNSELGGAYIDNENVAKTLSDLSTLFKNDMEATKAFADEALLLNNMGINMTGSLQKMMRNQYYTSDRNEQTTASYLNNLVNISKISMLSLDELVTIQEKARDDSGLLYTRVLEQTGDPAKAAKAQSDFTDALVAISSINEKLGLTGTAAATTESILTQIATATEMDYGELTQKYVASGMLGMSIEEARDLIYAGKTLEVTQSLLKNTTMQAETNKDFKYRAKALGVETEANAIVGGLSGHYDEVAESLSEFVKELEKTNETLAETVGKKNITIGDTLKGGAENMANFLSKIADPTWVSRLIKLYINPSGVKLSQNPALGIGGPEDSANAAWTTSGDAAGSSPWRLSAGFKSPAYRAKFGRDHTGADYAAAAGTLLPSTVAGVVSDIGYNATSGNYVKVTDGNGQTHMFAHMQSVNVRKGDSVGAGTVLGRVGSTGRSTGPHVHYGVAKNGQWINPRPWATSIFSKGIASGSFTSDNMIPATESILSSSVAVDNSGLYAMKYGVGGPDMSAPSAISSKVTSSNAYTNEDTVAALKNMNLSINDNLSVIIRLVADVVNTMNTNKPTDVKTISYIQR